MDSSSSKRASRKILSSQRDVVTIEESSCFWVVHRPGQVEEFVSGPFNLNDKRFSVPRPPIEEQC